MPTIPYPDVPQYPGVPQIPRQGPAPPDINLNLGPNQDVLANSLQNQIRWGIFDQSGNQLGVSSDPNAILSTNAFEFVKEMVISDFPVEEGGFANYNKVEKPASPTVTLVFGGTETDRSDFLNAINQACLSTDLYNIVTPEVTLLNYSLERYSLSRRADKGATLLVVEIPLKEIRQISASYSTTQTPINNPQNPAAVPAVSSGIVQPAPPPQSSLKSIWNFFPSLNGDTGAGQN